MLFNTTLVVEKYKYNVNYPKLHIIAFILEEDIPHGILHPAMKSLPNSLRGLSQERRVH